ncbi:MAG: hypothetical protein JWM56_1388 [Candidatus Peribacteria bacterium]|nr:hypothetical protein [Candidatus Peribacteria bacterium]
MFSQKLIGVAISMAMVLPVPAALAVSVPAPYQQDFVITAYYSPQPDQCCYVMGSYEADKVMNGNGTNGADGTPVFSGMIAAPSLYAFGTVIDLPGIGMGKVSDRGGAIQVTEKGVHRLDLWAGKGEEGLSRALAFGVKRVRGTVYPVGTRQPAVAMNLDRLSAPAGILQPYVTDGVNLLSVHPKKGDTNVSVQLLQEKLRDAGYFNRSASGFYGDETANALQLFLTDFAPEEPSDELTTRAAAFLEAAASRKTAKQPVTDVISASSSADAILRAKRTLRFLGYYKGRTNGTYDEPLKQAILAFQQEKKLIGDAASPGAGRIGPLTKKKLLTLWEKQIVTFEARKLYALFQIEHVMADKKLAVETFLTDGDKNDQVRILQRFLVKQGFLAADRMSGLFGPVTHEAVLAYQLAKGIILKTTDKGAGYVGPATLSHLRTDQREDLYQTVRAEGWQAL